MEHHRFERLELLVGSDGLQRLKNASVAVVGVGGVGSYTVEALARAGIGRLTLIDFDRIALSNINRQIHALEQTVGQTKVEAMAKRCLSINPEIEVRPIEAFFSADTSAELLDGGYDYLCDCIDSITAKLHLIESCMNSSIPVISAMGAANKLDPTLIRVGDLARTQKCRMARIMRKELGRRGIRRGVKVVYSLEEFRPLAAEMPQGDGTDDDHRPRVTLGSSSYIPPIFGLTMAGEVIQELLGGDQT
ncbi:tRNA cyclic N6-threonylcarbamoyladenosine(37) synthase TcdA [Syntrophotalea acetylenivorans]|uniref:tRNA cyclic N6-threonylcarbamoyladenosine(37) synthase TcdA n=1 Tax=Syntrophotalea acetylenivorans TaxID=1842532 RepID=A0A1L3GPX9_9BACT|nr:tRNA threonylcarbamoyladenosine dehydratase [Syntrophotalea acetylenivorans]APG27953.1 tRNA cyclic N6-threonylcarbamoyladenosine(37) synthase TcdA [Syntrophotalea acetylenivorans]